MGGRPTETESYIFVVKLQRAVFLRKRQISGRKILTNWDKSLNCPTTLISKDIKNHFFSIFSVRLGSKHNVRASILASSLCLDSASLRMGSIKSSTSIAGSVVAHSVSGRSGRSLSASRAGERLTGPPSLVIHSSSGVSSGSTSRYNYFVINCITVPSKAIGLVIRLM